MTTTHWHVASGLTGYGPDAADTDGFPTFDNVGDALDYARDELLYYIDFAHDGAHAAAERQQYEQAWEEIVRMERLEILRANLDPARQQAPLYVNDDAAYAALQETQASEFPHDVTHNSQLYLWSCTEDDCEDDDEQ